MQSASLAATLHKLQKLPQDMAEACMHTQQPALGPDQGHCQLLPGCCTTPPVVTDRRIFPVPVQVGRPAKVQQSGSGLRLGTPRSLTNLLQHHYEAMTSPFLPVQVDLPGPGNQTEDAALAALFAEELGLMLEVSPQQEQAVLEAFKQAGVPARAVGSVTADPQVAISVDGQQQITGQSFFPCGLPAPRQECRDAMWGRVRGCPGGRAALTVDGQQQLTSRSVAAQTQSPIPTLQAVMHRHRMFAEVTSLLQAGNTQPRNVW